VFAAGEPLNEYVIGRSRTCDIAVEDARVSSRHCRIYCEEVKEPGRMVLKVRQMI
jgi:pSer/pThr/pTyr-binding forkhead associated (FHA) protein